LTPRSFRRTCLTLFSASQTQLLFLILLHSFRQLDSHSPNLLAVHVAASASQRSFVLRFRPTGTMIAHAGVGGAVSTKPCCNDFCCTRKATIQNNDVAEQQRKFR
jgi:hypothetical protein